MSVVRRKGGWCLERSAEGVYLITHRSRVRAKVVTDEHVSPGDSNERHDRTVPVREVSSLAEVEHVFTSMANGDAFVPVPAGVTRSTDASTPDALPDLPLGGIVFVGLLVCGCFASLYATVLHPAILAVGIVSLLAGTVVAGVGYREYRRRGSSAMVERLRSLYVTGEESRVEDLAE
ncbi:hypothetical protein [Salinigranum salinum]|uniref:hypothetical protein n=1 Tax=Salinigranum salinum TaxID=1364937 RepID=UPI001260CB09|nr:hypothetical protein [Salinigranum salinum]